MDVIIWFVILSLFIVSFLSILYPIIPSVLFLWLGFFLYHFFINNSMLGSLFFIMMSVLTIILITADIIANSYFIKRFGGSKQSERAAVLAVIVGAFILPPFGVLIIPFITVLIIEMIRGEYIKNALLASIGSLIGFLSSMSAKVMIQFIMILWFFIVILYK